MMNANKGRLTGAFMLLLAVTLVSTAPVFAGNTYTMKEGDTLWELSAKYYNDPTLYPVFLEVNNIDNPRMIPVGKVIIIPSFDDMKKVSQEVDPTKRKDMIRNLSGSTSGSSTGLTPAVTSETGKGEETEPLKPIDPKSVSIMKIMGGQKVDSKTIKDDKGETAPQNP